jgi:alpha-ketoglutarate-dependent dioxygenase alkB family protein 2
MQYMKRCVFVRYKDGLDKMGFHRDDEKELNPDVPIASLTLGAERDFIFRHCNRRAAAIQIPDEKLVLTDGLLLLMRPPTNQLWYHGLPVRRKCTAPRINLTFRSILVKKPTAS